VGDKRQVRLLDAGQAGTSPRPLSTTDQTDVELSRVQTLDLLDASCSGEFPFRIKFRKSSTARPLPSPRTFE
jgi:hypothetical protein